MTARAGALQCVRVPVAEVFAAAVDDVALVDGCKRDVTVQCVNMYMYMYMNRAQGAGWAYSCS